MTTFELILSGLAELARASFGCFEGRVLFFGFETLKITLRGVWDEPSYLLTDPLRVARQYNVRVLMLAHCKKKRRV
jgi:hypothetical protein